MNAKLLETLIREWHQVAVKHKNWIWRVFMFIDWDWNFQWTVGRKTIQDCLSYWLIETLYPPRDIEKRFTNEYKVVTPTPLLLKKWDKVEILENLREYAERIDWSKEIIEMIWQKGLGIYEVLNGRYIVYNEEKSNYFYFPHRAVAKYEPQEDVEDKTEEAMRVLKEAGYKIIKE